MITITVLVVVALGALYAIASPVLTHMRRPWQFNAPSGEEESLRQEQIMVLDALRDLAMDYRMGQLSEEDYRSLAAPLQKRAKQTLEAQMGQRTLSVDARLTALNLDANAELDAELEAAIRSLRTVSTADERARHKATHEKTLPTKTVPKRGASVAYYCTQCGEKADPSFRFCGFCGAALPTLESTLDNVITDETKPLVSDPKIDDLEIDSPAIASAAFDEPTASTRVNAEHVNADHINADEALVLDAAVEPQADSFTAVSTNTESVAVEPVGAKPVETAAPSIGRWWIIGALLGAIWIAAIIGIYLNGRAGQESQTPVTTLPDGPVVTLAATMQQTIASSAGGLYISTDLDTWSQSQTANTFLSITPIKGQAGSWLAASVLGLWRTADDGNSWEQIDLQPAGTSIQFVASAENGLLWGANADALFSSDDQGATWRQVDTVLPGNVQALAVGPANIFIGSNQGVFRSIDQGTSWINSNGAVNGRIGSTNIQVLAYDQAGSNLFAGTPQGLYFLNLENVSGWGRRTLDADVRSLAIPNEADNILWVGTAKGEIFRSTDRGVTWRN